MHSYQEENIIPVIKEANQIGSIKRKTKIRPLDDVDILLVIGIGRYHDNGWHVIDDCSYEWERDDKDENDNISSIHILNKLRDRLLVTYPNSEIKRNNEVVNVYLKSYDVGFDLVPGFYIRDKDYYLIPKGSKSTQWKKTNPKIDELILNNINSNNNNRIKDVIKMAKYFFSYKKIPRIRSYHLESCAYHIFKDITGNYSTREYLKYFYSNIDSSYLNSCIDPTGLSDNLTSYLESEEIIKILSQLALAVSSLDHSEEDYCEFVGFYN